MFKVLRKAIVVLLVLVLGGIVYHYLGNAAYRRQLVQKAEELNERLRDEKKFAWRGTAVVLDAIKGDRVAVDTETTHKVIVRLAGIDAPELPLDRLHKGQPLAEESRDHLSMLVKGKAVEMAIVKPDADKQPLVLLTLDGELINAKMVQAGLAEVAEETCDGISIKIKDQLENAELRAKQDRLGIWTLTNYVRPIEFRIRNKVISGPRHGTD